MICVYSINIIFFKFNYFYKSLILLCIVLFIKLLIFVLKDFASNLTAYEDIDKETQLQTMEYTLKPDYHENDLNNLKQTNSRDFEISKLFNSLSNRSTTILTSKQSYNKSTKYTASTLINDNRIHFVLKNNAKNKSILKIFELKYSRSSTILMKPIKLTINKCFMQVSGKKITEEIAKKCIGAGCSSTRPFMQNTTANVEPKSPVQNSISTTSSLSSQNTSTTSIQNIPCNNNQLTIKDASKPVTTIADKVIINTANSTTANYNSSSEQKNPLHDTFTNVSNQNVANATKSTFSSLQDLLITNVQENFIDSSTLKSIPLNGGQLDNNSKDYLFRKDIEEIYLNIKILLQKDIMSYFISETETEKQFTLQHIKKVENKMKRILKKMKEMQTIYNYKWFAMSVTSFENIILYFNSFYNKTIILLKDQSSNNKKNLDLDLRRTVYQLSMEDLKVKIPDWLRHLSKNIFILDFNTLPEPNQIDYHYDHDFSEFDILVSSDINRCFAEYKPALKTQLVEEDLLKSNTIIEKPLQHKFFDEYNFIDEYLIKNCKISHNSKNNLISLLFGNRKLYMLEHLCIKQIYLFYTYFITLLWKYHHFGIELNDLLPYDKRGGMGFIAYYIFKRKFDEDLSSKEFFFIKKTIVKFQFDNDIQIYDEFIEPNSKLDRYLDYLHKMYL